MARFAVVGTFALTGRGFVLVGNILEGTLCKGMRLQCAREGQREEFEIVGVGLLAMPRKEGVEVGLLLPLQAVREASLDEPKWWVGNQYEYI